MAALSPTPFLQFTDANGAPLSGGKLYTYAAGTTTPLATYTDSGGGTPNANPVILDSRGQAAVWLGNQQYKFVLKSSTDVTIKTTDNINGVDQVTLAALAVSGGSALIGYLPSGTGAVTTTVQTKLRESVSVLDFGANTTPGITDMTEVFAAAILAVKTAGGGEVYIPEGVYLLTGVAGSDAKKNGILIPFTAVATGTYQNRVRLRGCGRSTVLKAGSTGMYIIRLSDSQCSISDLTIWGNGLGTTTGLGIVPENTSSQSATVNYQGWNEIRNVWIRNCTEGLELMPMGAAVDASVCECRDNRFYNLDIMYCTRGRWLRSGVANSVIQNNRNLFFGGNTGQTCNTGYQIDSGTGNEDHGMIFEQINSGVSPNATPTGIKIAATDAWGNAVDNNKWFGGLLENGAGSITRKIDNASTGTELHGLSYDATTCLLTEIPYVSIGGFAISRTPQVFGGLVNYSGANSAFSNYWNNKVNFTNGLAGPLQAANVTNSPGLDAGQFYVTTGSGGGNLIQGFKYDWVGLGAQCYLAISQGVSDSNTAHNCTRLSLFIESQSAGFTEINISDTKNTITNSTISLSRTLGVVTMTTNVLLAAEVLKLTGNLIRLT